MPSIIGNLEPRDDYTHEPGPESNFNESVYFNFFDREHGRGGFVRMGNRVNEGYAELTLCLFEPDGSVYFNYRKPDIDSNDGWNAGGMHIEVLAPVERVRTRYEGKAVFLADPLHMTDPRSAFKDNPWHEIHLDLIHEGVGPLYGHVGEEGDGNEFARAHYEQHMRVHGTLAVDGGRPHTLHGHGLRDHSWGPRYWQATPSYRWITGNFGDDLGMILTTNGEGEGKGLFQKGDALERIDHVRITPEYREGTRFHSGLVADITTETGAKHRLEGRVLGFIPLRNRRAGQHTHIGEGMTEYRLDGERVGYGLSEFLDNDA
jgi:hypothetical protein